jgi:hypothetical protein
MADTVGAALAKPKEEEDHADAKGEGEAERRRPFVHPTTRRTARREPAKERSWTDRKPH